MFAAGLTVLLSALIGAAPAASMPDDQACADVEQALLRYELTEPHFAAFQRIARHRIAAGLDVLPGFPFCTSMSEAVSELVGDKSTISLLAASGISPRDYLVAGWTVLFASEPFFYEEDHPVARTDTMRRNIAFAKRLAKEIRALSAEE